MSSFSINFNKQAGMASNSLKKNESSLQKAVERLSTGNKFNKVSDNPASFSLVSKLASDLLIGQQAVTNGQNGSSMLDMADAGLANIEKIYTEIAVLAEDASNGVWSTAQRTVLDNRVAALKSTADNIAASTSFNGVNLLDGSTTKVTLQIGSTAADGLELNFSKADAVALGTDNLDLKTSDKAIAAVATVNTALTTIRTQREALGNSKVALEARVESRDSMNQQIAATKSNIGDANIADEMENYTNFAAKVQASQYMYMVSLQNTAKIGQMIQSV